MRIIDLIREGVQDIACLPANGLGSRGIFYHMKNPLQGRQGAQLVVRLADLLPQTGSMMKILNCCARLAAINRGIGAAFEPICLGQRRAELAVAALQVSQAISNPT